MILFTFIEADVFNSQINAELLFFFSVLPEHLHFSRKSKLSFLPSAAGYADAYCRLIKCLPLRQKFMQVSDIQAASETNSLIEFRLSL